MEKTKDNTTFVISETHKASSYEFGKAGDRFKIYYETPEDLKLHIEKLKILGLVDDDQLNESQEVNQNGKS